MFAGQQPARLIRVIANLYAEAFHLVVAADGPIASVRDLAGKRVSLDRDGSGTRVEDALGQGRAVRAEGFLPSHLPFLPADFVPGEDAERGEDGGRGVPGRGVTPRSRCGWTPSSWSSR